MSPQLPPCVNDPLASVAQLFEAAASTSEPDADGDWGVKAQFQAALAQPGVLERIPEINAVGVEAVKPNALVRFRCMVQDMYNPEYYVGAYRDKTTGGKWRTTKFTEDLGPTNDATTMTTAMSHQQQQPERKIWERRVLYCVPLPGESAWVRRLDGAGVGAPPQTPVKVSEGPSPTTTAAQQQKTAKRSRELDMGGDVAMNDEDDEDDMDMVAAVVAAAAAANAAAGAAGGGGGGSHPNGSGGGGDAAMGGGSDESEAKKRQAAAGAGAEGTAAAGCGGGAPVFVVSDESMEDALNLPLGNGGGGVVGGGLVAATPCIVKVYDEEDNIKLNDVLELVGVLSIAPTISAEMEEAAAAAEANDAAIAAAAAAAAAGGGGGDDVNPAAAAAALAAAGNWDFIEEERAHNPPTSVVPRFHAIVSRHATPHSFAVLPARPPPNLLSGAGAVGEGAGAGPTPTPQIHRMEYPPELKARGREIREALVAHLAVPLGGDTLAAEYVLAALVSRIHTRTDSLALGKMSVTLLGAPEPPSAMPRALAAAIAEVVPCVAHLPLSIGSLNARLWVPRKDYGVNRLRSGPLQLAPGTALVLDETALSAGQLGETGMRNIHSLQEMVSVQELEYDFQYHQMRMPVDIPTVVVSPSVTSGSVIQGTDAKVPLRMTREPAEAPPLHPEMARAMRAFIACARGSDHTISRGASADIEAAMVAARQGEEKATQEQFHRWLTMARLWALSAGETDLTIQHWRHVMECQRKVDDRLRVC